MNSRRQLVFELMLVAVVVSVEWVGGEPQEMHTQPLIRLYSAAFWRHFECTPPEQRLHKLLAPRLVTLRAHTGHRYFVVEPGFGCTSPESRMHSHGREEPEGRCGFDEQWVSLSSANWLGSGKPSRKRFGGMNDLTVPSLVGFCLCVCCAPSCSSECGVLCYL